MRRTATESSVMGGYRKAAGPRDSRSARRSRNDARPLPTPGGRSPLSRSQTEASGLVGPQLSSSPLGTPPPLPRKQQSTSAVAETPHEEEELEQRVRESEEQIAKLKIAQERAMKRRSRMPPPKKVVKEEIVALEFDDDDTGPLNESGGADFSEFDDEELDEGGADNPEDCKMVVKWGEPGVPPPVPSRDDPSYALSEEQALAFCKQKQDIPGDYETCADDPRYMRLRNKWSPNIFSVKGAKQFAKNKIHPKSLPYVGVLFHAAAAADGATGVGRIKKIEKMADNEELKSSFSTMKGAQRTMAMQETAYTGVAAALMFLPLIDIVPGLSAQLMVLGTIGAEVAEKGIEMGLKVIISRGTAMVSQATVTSQEAFGSYGQTKAFLMYLGAPENKDPVYSHWEKARLRLKALYGCAPEDNVFKMKPSGMLLQKLRLEEAQSNRPYTVELPLLVMLFRAFNCWDDLYYDKIIRAKQFALTSTQALVGAKVSPSIEAKRLRRDRKKLEANYKWVEREKPIDPHLQILKPARKKEIISVLAEAFLHSNRLAYLFITKKLRIEQKGVLKWFFTMVVEYFLENNAYFWGYVAEDGHLLGVAIWEHPDEKAKVSMVSMLRTSGAVKLGPTRFKQMIDMLSDMEEMRKGDIRGIKCWMLHWIGVRPIATRQCIGKTMVENCIARHTEPLYVQVLDCEKGASEFFKQCCFVKLRKFVTRAKYFEKPIACLSYWQGIETPEELRALARANKKKTTLQLTYSTMRKASSTVALRLTNQPIDAQPRDSYKLDPEYKDAMLKLEEAKLLLENLKLSLAQLPIMPEGEEDEATLLLRAKIEEQKVLVTVMQRAVDALVPSKRPKAIMAAIHTPASQKPSTAPVPYRRRSRSLTQQELRQYAAAPALLTVGGSKPLPRPPAGQKALPPIPPAARKKSLPPVPTRAYSQQDADDLPPSYGMHDEHELVDAAPPGYDEHYAHEVVASYEDDEDEDEAPPSYGHHVYHPMA